MRADTVSIAEIQKLPRNPKAHDLGTLHRSMDRFGYLERVVINDITGRLLAGHGRIEALGQKKLSGQEPPEGVTAQNGDWMVPVDYVNVDPDEENALTSSHQ